MAGWEVPRGNRKANLVVQLARGRDIAVLLNVEPHARVAQAVRATLRIFVPGDNCVVGIKRCAGSQLPQRDDHPGQLGSALRSL